MNMKKIKTKNISSDIIIEDLASLIREVVPACYGVIGIANIAKKKGKKEEGLEISLRSNNQISVTVYLVVDGNVKITETIRSCQKTIIYRLSRVCPGYQLSVSVYAEEISSHM